MKVTHQCPVRVLTDTDCIKNHASELAPFGFKALIVTGRYSAKANGALDDVVLALKENGQEYSVFDKVMANPNLACVYEGAEIAWKEQVNFLIAIGGGSAIDAAKAISLLCGQELKEEQLFTGPYGREVLPLVCVPTTAGTGSEVTQYSILTDDKHETKRNIATPLIFPALALLDAKYLVGLPSKTSVYTAIDALSHSIEGMLSVRADYLSDILALEGIRLIASCLTSLGEGTLNEEERERLLFASTLGGIVISSTGTTAVHALGYSLTYYHHIDHGKANGLLLVAFLRFVAKEREDLVEKILQAVGFSSLASFQLKLEKMLGPLPRFTDSEIKQYARKAFATKNIGNSIVQPTELDLREMLEI
jgi:alcohol dehydrogenase class IV